ncbi:hypothetical protein HNY73_023125 [Argiope bruennichi]|uniref:GTP-binding protein n=1 Tax=Argiope bruennichi TaxID=94029 RepID=A0A8T0E354_ARGBR|nr:hypothetical protein HNY73_023125 [Argiope bruennichi]
MTSRRQISRRQKNSSSLPDLRHTITQKIVGRLRHECVALIGDEGTGRNTLVRRFLNMSAGPFLHPEHGRYRSRSVLVDLSERPSIGDNETVNLIVFIFNFQELDFATFYYIISHLRSCAVIFDIGRSGTFYIAVHSMVKIAGLSGRSGPRYILVGNKIDLQWYEISPAFAENVAEAYGAQRYYGCSALRNINMDRVLDAILLMALSQFADVPL